MFFPPSFFFGMISSLFQMKKTYIIPFFFFFFFVVIDKMKGYPIPHHFADHVHGTKRAISHATVKYTKMKREPTEFFF